MARQALITGTKNPLAVYYLGDKYVMYVYKLDAKLPLSNAKVLRLNIAGNQFNADNDNYVAIGNKAALASAWFSFANSTYSDSIYLDVDGSSMVPLPGNDSSVFYDIVANDLSLKNAPQSPIDLQLSARTKERE